MTWFTPNDLGPLLDECYPLEQPGFSRTANPDDLLFAHPDWGGVYFKLGRTQKGRAMGVWLFVAESLHVVSVRDLHGAELDVLHQFERDRIV